jgi:uncharacterized membrane protein
MTQNNREKTGQNLPQQTENNFLSNDPTQNEYHVETAFTLHVGPLPPPETVERYERIMAGTFDRILTMAEKAQQSKIEYNGEVLTILGSNVRSGWFYAHCGQTFGFVSVVLFFAGLLLTIWNNNTVLFGALFCAGAITGLARLVRSFQVKDEKTKSTNPPVKQ